MRQVEDTRHDHRLNALIVVLWRAGLGIQEALSLTETDLDQRRGSILVRHGKNDRRREVGMDAWGWSALEPWLADRVELAAGPPFCVIDGTTRGRAWSASAARIELHHVALKAGVRRRFAPHQLRHVHAVELLNEGIPLPLIQRQLGHSHLSTTATYLQGIDTEEINSTVHARRAPMMHASAGPRPVAKKLHERVMRSRALAHRCSRGQQQPGVHAPCRPSGERHQSGECCSMAATKQERSQSSREVEVSIACAA